MGGGVQQMHQSSATNAHKLYLLYLIRTILNLKLRLRFINKINMKICTYPKLYSLYKDKEIKFLNSLCKVVGYYMIENEVFLLAQDLEKNVKTLKSIYYIETNYGLKLMDFHGDPYAVYFDIIECHFKNKDASLHEAKSEE